MAASFEEKVEQARQELRVGLRKQCSADVPNEVVDTAEAFVWHGSIATQAQQSHQRASDLPDRKTLALYIARAADEKILNRALMRATVHELDKKDGVDVGSIAQRVRTRSRGRSLAVPQTEVEAAPPGNVLQAAYFGYLLFGMFCLVVYMVEQIQKSHATKQ
jgi:F420-0:gamma-glutamyl ligase-like protein